MRLIHRDHKESSGTFEAVDPCLQRIIKLVHVVTVSQDILKSGSTEVQQERCLRQANQRSGNSEVVGKGFVI